MKCLLLFLCVNFAYSIPTGTDESETPSDEPWNWNIKPSSEYEVTVEEIIPENAQEKSAMVDIQPRFVGKLKKKLCKMGIGGNCISDELHFAPKQRNRRNAELTSSSSKKQEKVPGQTSSRLLNSGLDGLVGPSIAPSIGVHLGSLPQQGGGHHLYGAPLGGHKNPFQLDLGPFSLNPFAGIKLTLHNGKPVITPSLDLLVTKNKHKNHYPETIYDPHQQYGHEVPHDYYSQAIPQQYAPPHYPIHGHQPQVVQHYPPQVHIPHPPPTQFRPSPQVPYTPYHSHTLKTHPLNIPKQDYIPTDYAQSVYKPSVQQHKHIHHHNQGGYLGTYRNLGRANSNSGASSAHNSVQSQNSNPLRLRDGVFASKSKSGDNVNGVQFPTV